MRSSCVLLAVVTLALGVGCGKKTKMEVPKSPALMAPSSSPGHASGEAPRGDLEVSGGEANLPAKEALATDGRCLGRYESKGAGAITFYDDQTCKLEQALIVADRNECAFSMSEGEVRVTTKKTTPRTGSFAAGCKTATFGGVSYEKAQ